MTVDSIYFVNNDHDIFKHFARLDFNRVVRCPLITPIKFTWSRSAAKLVTCTREKDLRHATATDAIEEQVIAKRARQLGGRARGCRVPSFQSSH